MMFETNVITRTELNGVHLEKYDDFERMMRQIEKDFITQDTYNGFPSLPDDWLKAFDMYESASDTEREWMFKAAWIKLMNCYRQWCVDKDELYTDGGIERHDYMVNMFKTMGCWKEGKRNWNSLV